MIVMFFVGIVKNLIMGATSLFSAVSLPTSMIGGLATITGYGAYVVGSDLLLIVASVITFWLSVKITVGIILFIWRLLPFT